jgi:hypothetical protein
MELADETDGNKLRTLATFFDKTDADRIAAGQQHPGDEVQRDLRRMANRLDTLDAELARE